MNFFEIFGFLHVVFYGCVGLFFIAHAAIKGFKTQFKKEDQIEQIGPIQYKITKQ